MYTSHFSIGGQETELKNIDDVKDIGQLRFETGVRSLDNLFDGGAPAGFVYTVTGDPGTGKTTMLFQLLEAYGKQGLKCGYASGEESISALKSKAVRMKCSHFKIAHSPVLDSILEMIEENDMIVVDALQALVIIGETKQVELKAINAIVAFAKQYNCTVFVVSHATKAGTEKGNSAIQHIVDGRLIIRHASDKSFSQDGRIFEFLKHRESRIGAMIFRMTGEGFDLNRPWMPGLYNYSKDYYRKG
jgi:DNA repair protein RadA/Sms